ncbi:MAG: Rho termination factor N-terminal domain-containing protein [Candidatus Lokiarchaeia archaeon]|nr:Rho termination factor N-terminal domain-containing protein [Candidatus Lokiarchaeia archaeon]
MTEIETFMVYELDNSGERIKLDIEQENLQENLSLEQVLVIIREDLRRIFIWKGPTSPVRKRFISSRVASALQEELMKDARYHRCKIISVDAGDEPSEFLNAFRLESMEVTERLEDMRYVRNIERERGAQATITDAVPKTSSSQIEEEYYSPALLDTSDKVVTSSYSRTIPSPTTPKSIVNPSAVNKAIGLSEKQTQAIKDKILKTEISNNYKRVNLILGHTLYAAVSKTANVFGKDVEETEWEPLKKVPKDMIELDNHLLRVYFDDKKGIVEAVEVLQNLASSSKSKSVKEPSFSPTNESNITIKTTDFKSMTVKDLKAYAEEKNIDLQSNLRKAEIIEILEKSTVKRPKRNLPEIPKSD